MLGRQQVKRQDRAKREAMMGRGWFSGERRG